MSTNYRPLTLSVSIHPDAATPVTHEVLHITETGEPFASVEVGGGLVRVIFLSYSPDALREIGRVCLAAAHELAATKEQGEQALTYREITEAEADRAKLDETYEILNRITYAGEPDAPR